MKSAVLLKLTGDTAPPTAVNFHAHYVDVVIVETEITGSVLPLLLKHSVKSYIAQEERLATSP